MSGVASLALSLVERLRGGIGVPDWVFLVVSAACFFAAFNLAWLDKDKELEAALGSAPEVLLEWQPGKKNPLMLRNLRGSTAYRVKIKDVVIEGGRFSGVRCSATFDEVPHIAEGASISVLPQVTDMFVNPEKDDEWKAIKDDFLHVLEAAYQTYGHDFNLVDVPVSIAYEDRNGRRYTTNCNVSFDRYRTEKTILKCEPPKPVVQ
jgi:hypothetical protein